jgi:hypothetical protein
VVVQNLAYEKDITVVYTDDEWETTYTHSAEYVGMVEGTDLDRFKFQTYAFVGDSVEFALASDVNGQTNWDNNGGENYFFSTSGGSTTEGSIGEPKVQLLEADLNVTAADTLSMDILAETPVSDAELKLVYAVDGGEWQESVLNAVPQAYDAVYDLYQVSFPLSEAGFVHFALMYTLNGEVYWDNFHYLDYSLNSQSYKDVKVYF